MPPRLSLLRSTRTILARPSPLAAATPCVLRCTTIRGFADSEKPPLGPNSPNQYVLPPASEEAATLGKVTDKGGLEIEQGVPVQEVGQLEPLCRIFDFVGSDLIHSESLLTSLSQILKRDQEGLEKAPQVIREELGQATGGNGRASSSTLAAFDETEVKNPGHKYALPELPLASDANLKYRYDPVVQLVTNLMMRDGKLSVAQRNMSLILQHLRASPPPLLNPERPLLPSAPPPTHLPLNPTLYLMLAIDSVAPLLRIRAQKGAAGGGAALQIPVPLGLRQRRRRAVEWVLDAASKRRSRGSGKGGFAQRVAEEIVSVVEGRSTVWDKRGAVHKLGVSARANLNFGRRR